MVIAKNPSFAQLLLEGRPSCSASATYRGRGELRGYRAIMIAKIGAREEAVGYAPVDSEFLVGQSFRAEPRHERVPPFCSPAGRSEHHVAPLHGCGENRAIVTAQIAAS